jgi:hypothetical protein
MSQKMVTLFSARTRTSNLRRTPATPINSGRDSIPTPNNHKNLYVVPSKFLFPQSC